MDLFLVIILAILIGEYLLNLMVDVLNIRHLSTELPKEFMDWYDPEKYRKSQEYIKETTRFHMIEDSISTPLVILFILLGGFGWVDQFVRGFDFGSVATGLLFAGILLLASQVIAIPFSAYSTFVIEEKYGFNQTTFKTFVLDILKTWLLVAVMGGALFSAVLWLFETSGPWAWIYCWMAVTLFQIGLMFVAPVVIMPIFNKFVPLDDGGLKAAIEEYAKMQHFRLKGVFTMDGSRRSAKSNAFFTGFGRFRRIVLLDTLIEKHTTDELVSVLAHEMGHYKKRHILKSMGISILTSGLMFYILSFFINNQALFAAFQVDHLSVYASLFFFGFLYVPIEMILAVLGNVMSRRHEYEADEFAVSTYGKPRSLISALKKLSVDHLSNLTPHPLKVFLSYSHPPVLERIRAIRVRGVASGTPT